MAEGTGDPRQALLSVVVTNTALALLIVLGFWVGVFAARRLGRTPDYSLAPLGFAPPRGGTLRGLGLGVATGVGALLMSLVVNPITVFVLERLGYPTRSTVQQPFMRGLEGWVREDPTTAIPAIVGVVVLFGPAVEELVFRGALFNGLHRLTRFVFRRVAGKPPGEGPGRTAFVLAAGVSSVLFALLHLEPVLLPALLIFAFALCWLFERTGSLLPVFAAHATFNSFATTLIILSGLEILRVPV
ncbi:hypothetical protein RxyAA322_17440 [Rubrobacter xylanophilus]|uniref:CAAX prenyl protease 2/Lysostaphin resistance protein A-like domain-containing protein n=1 Tax=Rubrobacter xylanophilus TaxID=49319 RepID=A0A510HIS5_9ACTN|nr:CPBP family intramembrane glutamic endopeptidase [Rubrobacter xylanophilus]BBL79890.1 hypothetical protein RxyAA322_17440 [Rubrobacter xylanophilus]